MTSVIILVIPLIGFIGGGKLVVFLLFTHNDDYASRCDLSLL